MTTTTTVRARVNQSALLKRLDQIFTSRTTFLAEMMQNARRAGATFVGFEVDAEHRRLTVTDDGIGITDFDALVHLCESGWDEDVVLKDSPFGMGFFSVLFAAQTVTIRSKGKSLTLRRDDIVTSREVALVEDETAPLKGTVFELIDLDAKLNAEEVQKQVARYALGFPIDVQLDGVQQPRPHAQANRAGIQTPLGFVSLHDVHIANTVDVPGWRNEREVTYYLQGLPIRQHYSTGQVDVVHLDSQKFQPRMPDRTELKDGQEALEELKKSMRAMRQQMLVQLKAKTDPKDFLKEYFNICGHYGMQYLLNDIPWLPASAVNFIQEIHYDVNSSHAYSNRTEPYPRSDFTTGAIKAWRNIPDGVQYENGNGALLRLAQRLKIADISTSGLDEKHWIMEAVPAASDLVVELSTTPVQKQAQMGINDLVIAIQLVDEITVVVTSEVDPTFRLVETIKDSWVIQPDFSDDAERQEGYTSREDVVCFVTPNDYSPDTPPNAVSDFCFGEHDEYDSDARYQANDEWRAIYNGFIGASLEQVVGSAVRSVDLPLQNEHAGQMVLAYAHCKWIEYLQVHGQPWLRTADIEAPEFWQTLLASVQTLSSEGELNAQTLRAAFAQAAGVQSHEPVPQQKEQTEV